MFYDQFLLELYHHQNVILIQIDINVIKSVIIKRNPVSTNMMHFLVS